MLRNQIIFFCLVFIFTLNPNLKAQGNSMIHYTVENGLPHQNVFSVLDDDKGYVWFSTSAGVVRFDGYNWKHFTSEDGLSDNDILKIFQDKDGRIWFLTFNGTFCYYYNGVFYNDKNSSILDLATINSGLSSVFEDSNETKWMIPLDNDLFVSINDFQVEHYDIKAYEKNVNGFFFELDEELILLTNEYFFSYQDGEFVIKEPPFPLAYNHRSYVIDSDTLYYVSDQGVIRLDPEGYEIVVPLENTPQLSNLSSMYMDSKGFLWLCTMNNGVYKYEDFKSKNYSYKHFLENEVISACDEDYLGNIWFTTIHNGVFMMPYNFTSDCNLTTDDGLRSNKMHAITKSEEGIIWLGSKSGFIYRYDGKKIESMDINKIFDKKNMASNHVLKIITVNDEVFALTNNGIVYFKDDGEYNLKFIKSETDHIYYAKKMILDHQNRITVSHTLGVSELVRKGDSYILEAIDGIPNKRTFTHYIENDGTLWYVNPEGVFKHKDSKINKYTIDGYKIDQRIKDIAVLSDSTLILTTNGQGAIFSKNGKYKFRLTKKSGLSSSVLSNIYTQNDTLWLNSTYGLDRISYEGNNVVDIVNFGKNYGLPTNQINDLYLGDNKVFVVSNFGLNELDKSFFDQKKPPPKVYINRVASRGVKIPSKNAHIKKDNTVSFDCSVVNFINQNDVLYEYKLAGLNNHWERTRMKHFDFASLEPGSYTFKFRAKRKNSDWSEPAVFTFIIDTPFWAKPFVFIMYIAILISFVSGVILSISKKKHAKKLVQVEQNYQIKSLEQRALQAMMNPHFIFNVLNSIQFYLTSNNSTKAQLNLTRFAKLIRKNLEINQEKFISIEEEIEYLELYLSLEKLRFDESFQYKISVDPLIDEAEVNIPTMLIQPFIENAIWHGIMPQGGVGEITLYFKQNIKNLTITVFDNGVGYDITKANKRSTHKSVGLKMTRERLFLMQNIYNQEFSMSVVKVNNENYSLSGTKVTIKLPLNLF